MVLREGLEAALGLGIRSVKVVTDHKMLLNHMLGVWRPTGEKLAKMINRALSVRKKFEQCEISLVQQSQVSYVVKLEREAIDVHIAKSRAVNARKENRETCTICLEDADITKIHAVEGCAHRFCFPCMKEHVKVKLLHGMLPACSQNGCTTKLTVEGSKVFLSPPLLLIMV
uniref:RING-type domain-containing protein n=1 Tax=Arundo donax TaxID=35708 RepID=A0A0A9HHA5_ARUDO